MKLLRLTFLYLTKYKSGVVSILLFLIFSFCQQDSFSQSTGIYESYAILNINGSGNIFYDLNATTALTDFNGLNLGTFTSSNSIIFVGGENKTFKCNGGNVTGGNIYYRLFRTSASPGSYTGIPMGFVSNDGGGCGGNQTWRATTGTTNILSGLAPGAYTIEVYSDAPGFPSTAFASNLGANYKATFILSGNYYSKSTGNLEITSTWGTNTDGTGTSPDNFTTESITYNIRNNANPTIGANWTVSGTGSSVILGNGTNACNFIIPSSLTFSVVGLTVSNNGTLTFATNSNVTALNVTNGGAITMTSGGNLSFVNGGTFTNSSGVFTRGIGEVVFNGTGSVIGAVEFHNLSISGDLTLGSGLNKSTIHNNLTINANGAIVAAAPFYAVGSTLIYNSGGDYKRRNEWSSSSVAAEQPFHVRISAGTILDMDVKKTFETNNAHYDGEGRQMRGDLDLYGTLTMGGNGGTMAEDLIVLGNVTIRNTGGLILGSQKPSDSKIADIQIGGNWLHETGGSFDASRRAVIFNGSTTAEQTVTFSATENFGYFIINKLNNGTVKMFCNARVIGTNQGSLIQLLNGNLDLNGNTMTLETFDVINNVEQNILIGDVNASILTRNINNTSATPATFRITHTNGTQRVTRVLQNVPGSLLSFGTNVVVVIEGSSSANMGVNFGNAVTTINGTLRINARGFVDINPPTYSTNSLLQYNIGSTYNRNAEWNASSGPGYPFNVQTSLSGTRLIAGGASNTATALNMAGSLTVDASTTFDMTNANTNNMTVPLIVGLDINNAGTLLASQTAGGNIVLGRNWSRTGAGIFTPYLRSVTFNTSTDATLSAPSPGETFYDLIVSKPSAGIIGNATTPFIGYRVTMNSPTTIVNNLNLTSGYFVSSTANLLTINAGGSSSGGAIESFVSGPLRKLGSTDFSFPVGRITNTGATEQFHYRPIAISSLGASADYIAQFYRANPYLQGPISTAARNAGLQVISYCEYWDLTRATGTNTIVVTPSWSNHPEWSSQCNNINYVLTTAALRVVPFNGPNPLPGASQWGDADFGQSGLGSGNQSYIQTISWNGALNYNKFVLGSNNWQLAPLPFEMKYFKASGKENKVQLEWAVNFNQQVKNYVIERSRDGIRFETLKQVIARSNETNASYADADPSPFNGWGYYRLRITDISGQITYTSTQKVWMGKKGTFIQILPNPAISDLWVSITEPEKITELNLMNGLGQVLYKNNRVTSQNRIDVSSLSPGIYYLRMTGKDGVYVEMFVKK